jgi:NTP pyrophosphatase (non-canonical NTP hydrolase)
VKRTKKTDTKTTISALKKDIAKFVAARDWAQFHAPKNLAMAVACEAAELMEHYLWVDAPASAAVTDDPARRAKIEAEVADIALCLLNFCNVVRIDLSTALCRKLAEASAKYPAARVRGKALKYDEY